MEKRCFHHPDMLAMGTCHFCGRHLCEVCAVFDTEKEYCLCEDKKDCYLYRESLAEKAQHKSSTYRKPPEKPQVTAELNKRRMARGAIFIFGGIAYLLAYFVSSSSDIYYDYESLAILLGAIFFGLFNLIRGFNNWLKNRDWT